MIPYYIMIFIAVAATALVQNLKQKRNEGIE